MSVHHCVCGYVAPLLAMQDSVIQTVVATTRTEKLKKVGYTPLESPSAITCGTIPGEVPCTVQVQ